MFKLLKPKQRSILGIDISSSAVKVLEISGTKESFCIENYRREPLPVNALDGKLIKDIDAVAYCIKKACNGSNWGGKQVALAVPDSSVIFKSVQINNGLYDDELEERVVFEADKLIPYPIDEINIDFEVQGPCAKNAAMLDILIVATRATNITSRVEAVVRAGFEVKVVDVESFAVERAAPLFVKELPDEGKDKIVAIIDIGANYTHLFVLNNLCLVFTREEKFGAIQLIQAIAEQYNITPEQAEVDKTKGTLPPDYESKVLEPFIEKLLLHIKRTMQFFYSNSHFGNLDHILLAGGFARHPGLADLIEEQLGVVTSLANPFSHMSMSNMIKSELINNDAPGLLVACGLALRHGW